MPIARERNRVEVKRDIHHRLVQLMSSDGAALDAGLRDAPPLALQLLAFLCREAGEEIIERSISIVAPLELAVEPRHQAGAGKELAVVIRGEQEMHRRSLALIDQRTGAAEKSNAVRVVSREETRTGPPA
jgi:hypothetical protein